jgi:hypothetical protein
MSDEAWHVVVGATSDRNPFYVSRVADDGYTITRNPHHAIRVTSRVAADNIARAVEKLPSNLVGSLYIRAERA